jgi:hypothetical protein
MMPRIRWAFAVGAAASCLACGSGRVPVPTDQWAAAQADVGRAQAGGALDEPEANVHLQLAQEDLRQAQRLMGSDNRRAASLCALARAEAQFAVSLVKQASAEEAVRRALADLQRGIAELQSEATGRPHGYANGTK